jgi:hypothetical protein
VGRWGGWPFGVVRLWPPALWGLAPLGGIATMSLRIVVSRGRLASSRYGRLTKQPSRPGQPLVEERRRGYHHARGLTPRASRIMPARMHRACPSARSRRHSRRRFRAGRQHRHANREEPGNRRPLQHPGKKRPVPHPRYSPLGKLSRPGPTATQQKPPQLASRGPLYRVIAGRGAGSARATHRAPTPTRGGRDCDLIPRDSSPPQDFSG